MKKKLIFVLFLYLLSCSKNDLDIKEICFNSNKKVNLVLKEKLTFYNSDTLFIGLARDIEVIKNRIYISDRTNCKIHEFDLHLNYIKSSGKCGRGPGEFTLAPYLTKYCDTLVIYVPGYGLRYLDSNFNEIKRILPPSNYLTDLSRKPVIGHDRILVSALSSYKLDRKKLANVTTALLFTFDGKIKKGICKFDNDFCNNSNLTANNLRIFSYVTKGFNNTYFVIQGANTKLYQYDSNGNFLRSYFYYPRFYKETPNITRRESKRYSRLEYYKKVILKTTFYKNVFFDSNKNLLYINYCNSHIEKLYSKSFTDTDSYLIVINNKEECIYDNKIEGYLVAVEDGYIYTHVKENLKKFVMNKYSLEINDKKI